MSNQTHPFDSQPAAELLKNTAKLEQLRNAPEMQKVFSMLRQTVGGDLECAADAAAKGDSAQLLSAIRTVMQNPEGARLIRQIKVRLK